jgi:hypothetical protein
VAEQAENDRWLVIYNNHNTPKLLGCNKPGTFNIQPFLPNTYYGAVLITTRLSKLRLGRAVAVRKLQSTEQSLEILANASGWDSLSGGI